MESRLEEAVQYARDFPQNSIRSVAKKYEVAHTTLRYRLKRYVDRLDAVNLAVRPEFIVDARECNPSCQSPAAKSGDPPTVGVHWVTRFIQRHGYCKQRQKTLSAERELDPETVIRPTPSGYTNDEISLDWVQHFDKHTNGCRKGRKRLLILDRHGSHHTKEFIEYCDAHGIIPSACPKPDTSTAATRCGGVPAVEALPRQSAGPHVRQVNKVARVIENGLGEVNEISPDLAHNMSRFIQGSLSNVAELLQTKKDLGRTRYAEKIAKQRRAMKNKVLQSGGVLTVQEGRAMVRRKEEDEVTKAREVIARMEAKAKNALKRWFNEAAKTARQWRAIGKLDRAEIYESGREVRLLKRF
ncbi:DDE superfamily endonuclease [Hirsutella rhossiliensis]|uniref:DDE superfamily endonuclease domain-containing protein n=1 Tax=Hirsutella rhossiliensis TaxID=111463 RepID=A0A9P8N9Y8_9HYPO|nr:DDE superfamily endonuclease domain-containing protein [Hirsutella rhossiliensis]KAH0968711.1 DDE superfamily endonuclease domain-containing protein [Hirsutella rhossiliensis]